VKYKFNGKPSKVMSLAHLYARKWILIIDRHSAVHTHALAELPFCNRRHTTVRPAPRSVALGELPAHTIHHWPAQNRMGRSPPLRDPCASQVLHFCIH
jgi:hypothetical protein